MKPVDLLGKKVGDGYPPYIISEIGVNFKTFEQGKKLVNASIYSGVDAVKIQTFKTKNLTSKIALFDLPKIGKKSQYQVFQELELSEYIQKKLFNYAKKKRITFFSTPSDKLDVDFLENLGIRIYKIGSDDANNIPFLEYIAKLHKPTIISTGMCTMEEVKKIKEIFYSSDNNRLILLHCVTKYPTEPKFVNLKAIETMKKELQIPIGYSDHCIGIQVCKAAIGIGANMIEKHVTLNKKFRGPDHVLSATPIELKELVDYSKLVYKALGDGIKRFASCEKFTRKQSRKSLVSLVDIPKNVKITEDMIGIKRPGNGIEPKFFKKIIGKRTKKSLKEDQVITWLHIY